MLRGPLRPLLFCETAAQFDAEGANEPQARNAVASTRRACHTGKISLWRDGRRPLYLGAVERKNPFSWRVASAAGQAIEVG